jgi:hypothetical protein
MIARRAGATRRRGHKSQQTDKEFHMWKKTVTAAILAGFAMGATVPVAQAHSGSNRTVDQYVVNAWLSSLYIALFGGPKGTTPPPK